jgi:hypothetical protein
MRSLTNTPIVAACVDLRVDGWRAGRTASSRGRRAGLARMAIAHRDFPILEGPVGLSTDQGSTHGSRVAPTSPAKAADRLGRRVSGWRSLPCPRARALAVGLVVWRDSVRRTPPWRRRFVMGRRSRQQPTAARNSVAPEGTSDLGLEFWFRSPLLGSAYGSRDAWDLPRAPRTGGRDHGSRLGRQALLPNYQLDAARRQPRRQRLKLNRTNLDCLRAASNGSAGLIERSGWHLRQPAELYWESLARSRNFVFRFTRMNFYGLVRFAESKISARSNPVIERASRSFLISAPISRRRIEEEWPGSARTAHPRGIAMRERWFRWRRCGPAIGADPARASSQATAHCFAFLIEDLAAIGHLGPPIYFVGSRGAGDPERSRSGIRIDVNIKYRRTISSNSGRVLTLVVAPRQRVVTVFSE